MQVMIEDGTISGYLETCDGEVGLVHVVDGTNITNRVLCNDLPCAVGTTNVSEAMTYLRDFINSLVTDGYEVDEFIAEPRGWKDGDRVDAIINY